MFPETAMSMAVFPSTDAEIVFNFITKYLKSLDLFKLIEMSDANEEKQVEMELTTVEESTIRNRFATKAHEEAKEQEGQEGQDGQGTGVSEVQEVQEQDADTEESTEGDSERDPVDTPSESEQEQGKGLDVQEDAFGREFIVYQGIPYYREETSWNTPFAVQLSFSLIMFINFMNIALAIGQMAAC